MTYNLSPFLLTIFSILNSCWLVLCSSFSWNAPVVSLPLRSLITYLHGTVFFYFTNNKNFFRPVWWCASFSKNIFVFRNSYMISNFEFRIFIINFFLKLIYVLSLTSTGFILVVLWNVLLYSPTISSNFSIYTLFRHWSHAFIGFSL